MPVLGQNKKPGEVMITRCWSYPVDAGVDIASAGQTFYVAHEGGVIEAVSASGTKQWATELGGIVASNVEAKIGYVAVVTMAANGTGTQLRSLSAETGVVRWSIPVRAAKKYSLQYGELTITAVTEDGQMDLFDAATGKPVAAIITPESDTISGDVLGNIVRSVNGKQVWRYRAGGAISQIIKFDDVILAASDDNFIYSISRSSGHVRWKHRLSGRVASMGTVGTDLIIVSSPDEHGLVILEKNKGHSTGRIGWSDDEAVTDIELPADGTILVLTGSSLDRYSMGTCAK